MLHWQTISLRWLAYMVEQSSVSYMLRGELVPQIVSSTRHVGVEVGIQINFP